MSMRVPGRPVTDLLLALVGPVIWFGHFMLMYAAEAFACARWPDVAAGAVTASAAVITATALVGLAGFAIRQIRQSSAVTADAAFLPRVGLLLAGLSAVAVIWAATPVFIVPVCAAP